MSIRRLMATAAGGLAIVTAAASTNPLQAQNAAADFKADSAFVREVAAANLMEVRLGQLAEKKAETPAVRQFGARMVTDHTSMQQQWMAVARKHGAAFNARYSSEQEQEIARLNGLSGQEFERAYMDLMVQDHQTNLSAFQSRGRAARSTDVRGLVERGIPVLQEHYNLATQIRSQVSGGAAVAANPNAPTQQPAAQPPTPWENVKRDPPRTPAQRDTQVTGNATVRANEDVDRNRSNQRDRNIRGADAQFVRDVGAHHFLEQRLGELAARKAENSSVRDYGRRMVDEHRDMQQRWIQMASRNGMPIEPGMGPEHRKKLTRLENRSGSSFDREYMSLMVSNHKGYLNAFQKEGRGAGSEAVRDLVDREIPRLMEHFNLAKRVGARVGADTSATLRATSSR